MITEPVTAVYDKIYWERIIAFPIIIVWRIYLIVNLIIQEHTVVINQQLLLMILLSVIYIGGFKMIFLRSFPRKIVVTYENITIYEYRWPKPRHIIITYESIKSTKTFREQRFTSTMPQVLAIELYDGNTYNISENDFENYGELKQAIYDHLFRHK